MQSRPYLFHVCPRLRRLALLALMAWLFSNLAAIPARAQAFNTLHAFSGSDGTNPYAALLLGKNGLLYGTTYQGGTSNAGTLFRVNTDGSGFQTLFNFSSATGGNINAALIQGKDGALYGTTSGYGDKPNGTVFKVNADGTNFQTLHSFNGNDGTSPLAALLQGSDGALYGTTAGDGTSNFGTLFRVNANGSGFQTLHSFNNTDGAGPDAPLLLGKNGFLYGTTYQGGTNSLGTLFRVNTDGSGFQTLFNFSSAAGSNPYTGVIQGKDGALYGTTSLGGGNGNGVLFRINLDGTGFHALYAFTSADGASHSGLLQTPDGTLSGSTSLGGSAVEGTVFKVNPNGTFFQTLHTFGSTMEDGIYPFANVILGPDGALYGTASLGGNGGEGTVFRLALVVQLAGLSVSPTSAIGGQQNPLGTILLDGPAPAGGLAVTLSSNNTGAATVPASVTVLAGKTSATFPVTTKKVPSNVTVRLTATANGVLQSTMLTVTPVPILVSGVTVAPNPAQGGTQNPTGTLTLSGPAPTGGLVVTLSSSNTGAATVPASVTVLAGKTSATFPVTTKKVPSNVTARLTAACNGSSQFTVLTVTH